jgi:hypothetical protein
LSITQGEIMSNVDPKTKVTAAQTRKNIAAYRPYQHA